MTAKFTTKTYAFAILIGILTGMTVITGFMFWELKQKAEIERDLIRMTLKYVRTLEICAELWRNESYGIPESGPEK